MFGMNSNAQQDLSQLGGMLQTPQNTNPLSYTRPADPTQMPVPAQSNLATNFQNGTMDQKKKDIAKKAVGGASESKESRMPSGLKWVMDYLNKRHQNHMDHEREILNRVLEQSRQRGGAAPDSLRGHEQEYYDNTVNVAR